MNSSDASGLPVGWVRTTLGDSLTWKSGGTPRSTENRFYGGGIPWAVIGDLNDGLVTSTASTISEAGIKESAAKWVGRGSVLVAMYGSIGKLGIAGTDLTTNQAIAFTDPTPIEPKYLFWYLTSVRRDLLHAGKGGTQQNISQTVLKQFPFPLPPLAEQRRIVAAVEEHLSRLDAAVAGLRRVKALLPRYRAAVFSAAFEGRLVEPEVAVAAKQGRTCESGAQLVSRLIGDVPTNKSPRLPDGWGMARLRDIAALKGGLTKGQRRRLDAKVRRVPYLRVANVQRGFLDLDDVREIDATDTEIADLALRHGDVLFNEGGDRDKLGRGWVWRCELPVCVHQNHVFRARPIPGLIEPQLLSWYGNSVAQAYFLEQGKQTTNLASINLTKLGDLPVPVPPAVEQRRIVEEIDRHLSVADAEARAVKDISLRADRLRESVLKRAFEGTLVAQDPTDEPATLLLARIQESRQASRRAKTVPA